MRVDEPDDEADGEDDRRELCPLLRARLEELLRERKEQELGRAPTPEELAALAAPGPRDPALPRLRFSPASRRRLEAMIEEHRAGSPGSLSSSRGGH